MRVIIDEKDSQITGVKLQLCPAHLEEHGHRYEQFLDHQREIKKKSGRYMLWTIVIQFLLSSIAFLQPVFLPLAAESMASSLIVRAFAEIGCIVSLFLSCKFAMAAFLPLTFCISIIISYSVVQVTDADFQTRLTVLSGLCVILNILTSITLCCYIKRKNPSVKSSKT